MDGAFRRRFCPGISQVGNLGGEIGEAGPSPLLKDTDGHPGGGIDGDDEFFGIATTVNTIRAGNLGQGCTSNKK
jgi:hypothetical protein